MPAVNIRARMIVRYSSTALALAGWLGAVWSWLDHGHAAGINTGFITALAIGSAFTMVAGQWWALPDKSARDEQASIYAMGYRNGMSCGACPLRPTPREAAPETSHLGIVR
jgi:hypothetical protein